MARSQRHLTQLYLASTMSLVAVIYVIFGGPRWGEPTLVLEATFAWLAVFVPPMVMTEYGLAMIRMARRLTVPGAGRPIS